jgi:hypothetical protein
MPQHTARFGEIDDTMRLTYVSTLTKLGDIWVIVNRKILQSIQCLTGFSRSVTLGRRNASAVTTLLIFNSSDPDP